MRKLKNEELNRLSAVEFREMSKKPVIIVLDNVRSLHNVGSIFRTADAFLVEAIYLCGITGTPPHREIMKTALGATETVNWKYFENTLEALNDLNNNGYKVYAVEQAENSTKLHQFAWDKEKTAFVFGHEVDGVGQEVIDRCSACIEVPQLGSKHSLNIAVCAGVVLWQVLSAEL